MAQTTYYAGVFVLLLVGLTPGASAAITVTTRRVDCMKQFNSKRKRAGLASFAVTSEPSRSLSLENYPWIDFCENLVKSETVNPPRFNDQNGILAFMPTSSIDVDCNGAVVHWGSAAKNFGSVPPVYTSAEPVYQNVLDRSLVALYNPGSGPTADCVAFTCTVDNKDMAHGLLCLSAPEVFQEGVAPFTGTQWEKITAAIASSATAVTLTAALLALPIAISFMASTSLL